MKARGIFFSGERGYHLLFDPETIAETFSQETEVLQEVVSARTEEIETVLVELLSLPNLHEGRSFVQALPRELQHVLVLLYFEILEGRLRRHQTLH